MATGAGGRDGEQILRDVRKRMCQEQDALIDAGDQTMTTLGRTIGATLLIGILVLSQIVSALPSSNGPFSGAVDQVETILNSSFLLAAILPLVIIAGAVLFYVRGFNGGGGGGGRMQ